MRDRSGVNRLARALDARVTQRLQRPEALELGTIQNNLSLKIDRFNVPIPKEDYLICRSLSSISPGDRVLVAWVNNGTDPVVIDVVMPNA